MGPSGAAIQLLKVWFATRPKEEWYPIDCRAIAEGLKVKVHGEHFDDAFEGTLCVSDGVSAIIYNEAIEEQGRKNFTVAHELGHYSLHKDKETLQCSMEDLNDYGNGPHTKNIEQEANRFAASLLMPTNDVRAQIADSPLTVQLTGRLAQRYGTTLTATSYRAVELATKPAAVVVLRKGKVHRCWRNGAMKQTGLWLPEGAVIDSGVLSVTDPDQPVNSRLWLDDSKAAQWELFQSYADMPTYDQTLFILRAVSREGEQDLWDDVEDSVDQFPK